jgi:electron transport complex protein RnfC
MRAIGAERAIIGVEDNKMDAVEAIRKCLPADGSITVEAVQTKYPAGRREDAGQVPAGRERYPPASCHARRRGGQQRRHPGALGQLLPAGQGLTERVVTVTGPGIKKPGDYWVPIGTPMRTVLEWAGAPDVSEREIILGGPDDGPGRGLAGCAR